MKKLLFMSVMTVFVVSCFGNDFKEQKFLGVEGNPKSIKNTTYKAVKKLGKVIKQDTIDVYHYEFNRDGYFQKMSHYNRQFDVAATVTYQYEDGKHVGGKWYYNMDTIITTLKERTSNSEIFEQFDGTNTLTLYVNYETFKRTDIFKDAADTIVCKSETTIDANGNIIEVKVYRKEFSDYWHKSTFNEKSQEIERRILIGGLSDEEEIFTYKYDAFDEKGNWTKKTEYKNGKIFSLTIREIEY